MYIDENLLMLVGVLVMWNTQPLLEALMLRFGAMTRTVHIIRPDPACQRCEGEGCYMHPLGIRVDCIAGCNEPKPQQVLHWRVRRHVEQLARRMGMDEKKALAFSREFEELANAHLGPPIPCFVRTDRGWEYRRGDEKAASA